MLARLRAFAKSWVALLLLGLLIVSFAVFGIGDVFAPRGGDHVVRAGDRTITGPEFKSLFDNYRQQLEQQNQQPFPLEQAVERGLHTQILDELAVQSAFAVVLGKLGLKPADPLVANRLREFPVFFSPVTRAFDRETYEAELAQRALTPERFERDLRDNIAQEHFVSGVVAGLRAPRVFGAAAAAFEGELRDVSLALVHPGLVERPGQPTDAQLTAFLRENASRLRRPELRALSLVRFNAAELAQTVTVDPAEVRRQFEFRRDSLSQPERRTFIQVPAPNQAAAAQVSRRLAAGEDPAAVARSVNLAPIPYDNSPRTAVTDPQVAAAAFSLAPGQVSPPVQGALGWSAIKLVSITPAVAADLESVRPQIEAELRAAAAEQQLNTLVERYEQARGEGANLTEAARRAGTTVLSLAPVARDGRTAAGAQLALEPALLEAAFGTPQGGDSDVLEIGPGAFAAVRVERVIAPALPTMEEIRAELTQAWTVRQLRQRLQARTEQLAAAARAGGGDVEAVARANNAPFTRLPGLTRAGGADSPPEIVQAAFGAKRAEVFTTPPIQTPQGPLGLGVGRVEAIRFPPAAQLGATVDQRRTVVTDDLLQDIGERVRRAARDALETEVSPDRALQALGIDPATVGGASSGGVAASGAAPGTQPAAR